MGVTERKFDGRERYFSDRDRLSMHGMAKLLGVPDGTVDTALKRGGFDVIIEESKTSNSNPVVKVAISSVPRLIDVFTTLRSSNYSLDGLHSPLGFTIKTPVGEQLTYQKDYQERSFGLLLRKLARSKSSRRERGEEILKQALQLNASSQTPLTERESFVLNLSVLHNLTWIGKRLGFCSGTIREIYYKALSKICTTPGVGDLLRQDEIKEIEDLRESVEKKSDTLRRVRQGNANNQHSRLTRTKIGKTLERSWDRPEMDERRRRLSEELRSDRWKEIRARKRKRRKK